MTTAALSVLQVLKGAREILARPESWTQNALAKDAAGAAIEGVLSEEATCWCASGAIWKAMDADPFGGDVDTPTRDLALDAKLAIIGQLIEADGRKTRWTVPSWNDALERTHEEVIAAFDRAIEAAA